ncbi:molecular chaperone (plasmid) [Paraburkholderia sp. PREW-6R]|uniref:fimbrial biogenesis chaperone n=1 Tax=Paraburkholderia sp. PREW-6R TaxID=3141544 RepID=UPI0031F53E7F
MAALCAATLLPLTAWPASLQISPVSVELQSGEKATGVTLRNPDEQPMYGQVRVFRWDQENGEDVLAPSQELIASPPLVEMAPHGEQLVRLVRANAVPSSTEQSYRLLIDELPQPEEGSSSGVKIRLRYSVPVFVEPAGVAGVPDLTWHLWKTSSGWTMRVQNTGTRRAQIAAVDVVDRAGTPHHVNRGLLGYALAGRAGEWSITLPGGTDLTGSVRIKANVNSLPMETVVVVGPPG